MKKLFTLTLFLAIGLQVFAQYSEKIIEQAELHFDNGEFQEAYDDYHYVATIYPEKEEEITFKKQVSFYLSEGKGLAPLGIKDLSAKPAELNYWLGRIHYASYDFDLAREYFKSAKRQAASTNTQLQKVDIFIEKATYVLEHPKNNDWMVNQLPAPFNSKYSDVSPAFNEKKNELMFFSSRPTEQYYTEDQFHVFESKMTKDTDNNSLRADLKLGDFDLFNSRIHIDNNQNIYFYHDHDRAIIYKANLQETDWQDKAEAFVSLGKKITFDSHFFVSEDAKTIIFTSAKNGQVDLYQIKYNDDTNKWEDPIFLDFNTEFNEDSPYLSNNGKTLYFSSDRPSSLGGYDVYKVNLDPSSGDWLSANNLGAPINTIDDDIDFQLDNDGQSGYLTSDRLGSIGEYDIFSILHIDNNDNHPLIENSSITYHND